MGRKSLSMRQVAAEFFGKFTGTSKGKGGNHIADMSRGVFGRSGMQGGHFPLLTGAAMAIQLRGSDQVSVCTFGEGAATSGLLHEALNSAGVWQLPVIYFCETNHYSETERTEDIWAQPDIAKVGLSYDIPYAIVGDNDVVRLAEAAADAIARARAGQGPSLVELKTMRMRGHTETEPPDAHYRPPGELASWQEKDPIPSMERYLGRRGLLTPEQVSRIRQEADSEVADAVRFAEESPVPPPDEAYTDVYGTLAWAKVG